MDRPTRAEPDALCFQAGEVFHLPVGTAEILDGLPDNIVVQDLQHRVLWLNRVAREAPHIPEDWRGRLCHTLWHGRGQPCEGCPAEEPFASGEPAGRISVTPDRRSWEVRTLPVRGASGATEAVIKIVREVSERVQAERTRDRLIRELSQKNEALERFADVVSHDLRSPLTSISGFAALLRRAEQSGDRRHVLEFIGRIIDAAQQMDRMVDGLCELSRAGRSVGELKPVSLAEVVENALDLSEATAREAGVELRNDVPVAASVLGDRDRLLQVLLNLVGNAVRHTREAPAALVRVGAEVAASGQVTCSVEDNGVGLRREHLERIFEPFEQAEPGVGGVGLGLSIARRIVEAHGGRIWAESAGLGSGCVVRFTVPAGGEAFA